MYILEQASARVHGTYANGYGVDIVDAHKVVDPEKREEVRLGLVGVVEAMNAASETPEAQTRFGYNIVDPVGRKALKAAGVDEYQVARICDSELDPAWVLQANPEEVVAVAGLMVAGREVALQFHKLSIWAVNSD